MYIVYIIYYTFQTISVQIKTASTHFAFRILPIQISYIMWMLYHIIYFHCIELNDAGLQFIVIVFKYYVMICLLT
jgi:hypothetical protein